MSSLIVLVSAALGLYMAWNVGANDVANSMADAVGARAISIRNAIIAAAICEFAGAVLVGSHVTETIRKGIVSPEHLTGRPAVLVLGMLCALLAAALWLHLATWLGMPVSTTHSVVGAVAGFGIVAAGWGAVNWGKMVSIIASWFLSPVVGCILAFICFKLISWFALRQDKPLRSSVRVVPVAVFVVFFTVSLSTLWGTLPNVLKGGPWEWVTGKWSTAISAAVGLVAAFVARSLVRPYLSLNGKLPLGEQLDLTERMFGPLVIVTSCSVAFAHGANDVANAVGPLAAVAEIVRTGTAQMKVAVPVWVLALGGIGIVLGLATFGYRVMRTVGEKITQITPTRGVAADVATTITVLAACKWALPISTTHTVVGAIVGVGLARGLGAVNRGVLKHIFCSWLLTVPAAAAVSVVLFLIGRELFLASIAEAVVSRAVAGG
jgi:PiT family inorganic phosphate transporter